MNEIVTETAAPLAWPILDAAAMPPAAEVFTHGMPGLPLDSGEFVPASQLNAPPAAPAVVMAALANALPAHRLDAVGDPLLLAEVRSFVAHVLEAFIGTKFPTQPKPGVEWWADTRTQAEALQRQIGAAA